MSTPKPLDHDRTKDQDEQNRLPMDGEESADPAPSQNPFDLSRLRLSQNFSDQIGVKKALITVPTRKPDRQWFIRVHPEPDWRLPTAVIDLKEDREAYLVAPELWPELPGELIPTTLFTAVNKQGVVFLWPVRMPDPDGRQNEWNRSALQAAEMAATQWIRIVANMSLGAYEVFEATGDLPDPEWPDVGFQQIVEIAFKDRLIKEWSHPVLKRLRGEL